MILYYSATGNTEFVAQELARQLDDECLNLLERIKTNDHSPIHSDKPLIICAPIIVCEMPRFMAKYLKEQTFTGCKDAYFVFTSGGYCGIAGPLAKSIMKKKGFRWHGHAEVQMPRNYVANDHYTMCDAPEAEERILKAVEHIKQIAEDIRSGNKLTARHVYLFEHIITVPFNPVWVKYKLTAKDFFSTEACVGCGKCVRLCPLNNIQLKDKKPVWGDNCTHCMACIGNCPTRGIEYGNMTQNKEQYNFGKYRYVVEKKDN